MFVRAKTIKGKKYAYLVENIWKGKRVSQKVKKYLGKIVNVKEDYDKDPQEMSAYDLSAPPRLIIRNIIIDDFLRKGFTQKGWKIFTDNITINLSTCKITFKDKSCVLYINGRYLFDRNLRQLQNFFEPEEYEDVKGQKLAQAFSDSGISIAPDVFVALYKKLYIDMNINLIIKNNKNTSTNNSKNKENESNLTTIENIEY